MVQASYDDIRYNLEEDDFITYQSNKSRHAKTVVLHVKKLEPAGVWYDMYIKEAKGLVLLLKNALLSHIDFRTSTPMYFLEDQEIIDLGFILE